MAAVLGPRLLRLGLPLHQRHGARVLLGVSLHTEGYLLPLVMEVSETAAIYMLRARYPRYVGSADTAT
jgi:hypothetical protein